MRSGGSETWQLDLQCRLIQLYTGFMVNASPLVTKLRVLLNTGPTVHIYEFTVQDGVLYSVATQVLFKDKI